MKLETIDFTIPAEVHWRNPSPHQPMLGRHNRHFTSLRNAVRFVVEDLTDFPQSTALISIEAGQLTFQQISQLYSRIRAR
jgi:hypothetical protein